MKYSETKEATAATKRAYVDGINKLIRQRQKQAEDIRNDYCREIFENQEKYRNDLRKILGWPLVDYETSGIPEVITKRLSEEEGYCIYRMQFEILEGLRMTGLFFKSKVKEPLPLVIVQHGGLGTPEFISGFYGDTANYNDMLERVRQQGVHVFAPQLLLWSDEYGVEYDRQNIDAKLKNVGSSVTALEIHGITRILDYFEVQSYVSTFGMVGLSYGGFYTLYTAALDTRIKSAISCSFFNKRDESVKADWAWFKLSEMFDDAEIACMVYPRRLYIEIGNRDELVDYRFGVESFERLRNICKGVGADWIDLTVFDGTHEFHRDDAPIKYLVKDLKG